MVAEASVSLEVLAATKGTPIDCAGNLPIALDDPQFVWLVERGAVDLFLNETLDGEHQSPPQHVLRADVGRLLPGVADSDGETVLGLVVKGIPDTVLRRVAVSNLLNTRTTDLAMQVDTWIADIAAMLSRDVENWPKPDVVAEPSHPTVSAIGTVSVRRGIAWVSRPPLGSTLYMGLVDPIEDQENASEEPKYVPLTPLTWLTVLEDIQLSTQSSVALAARNELFPALQNFHSLVLAQERLNRSLAVIDQANIERARATNRRVTEEQARRELFNLYGFLKPTTDEAHESALNEALKCIGEHEGIEFKRTTRRTDVGDADDRLRDILDVSGIRGRRIRLVRETKWWSGDNGAILGFRKEDGRPFALIPGRFGTYRGVDTLEGTETRIDAERATLIKEEGWVFYRQLDSSPTTLVELFRLGGNRLGVNLFRFVLAGLVGGLFALVPAVMFGFVIDEIILMEATNLAYLVIAVLALLALLRAVLYVAQGMALMRLDGHAASRMEAAFWDRLVRLPRSLLNRYSAGDLALRGMAIQNIRDKIQGVIGNAVLSILFLSPALLLVFAYESTLGTVMLGLSLLYLALIIVIGIVQVAPHGRMIRSEQSLAGRLFQLINGIAKLRVEGAEGSAFAVWAERYRDLKKAELEVNASDTQLKALGAAMPLITSAAIVLTVSLMNDYSVSIGDFTVVVILFLLFQQALIRLGESFSDIASVLPTLAQIQPFLEAVPESSADGDPVEALGGEILFDRISFRYSPEGPLILDDVTFTAHPGEFVAIAGKSGAGKSTLFRLALGLDQPTGGAVYYDGRDLKHLNVRQLRRQIGAVPQEVQLHPEDLWDNIVGDREDVTSEDAWNAAKMAAIDREISAMPMGMMTSVGMSASVTSGGESQRITIAHALLGHPRIMLLDEATNWLDNESQTKIMDNLAKFSATRIVIAHRLSTLRQADRIYVLRSGKVVQEGTYEELASVEGDFQDLVRRQMA